MNEQEIPQQPDKPEKKPGVFGKARNKVRGRWYRTKFMRWLMPTYPYKFAIGLKHDNFFWSRFNGAFNGATLIGEAWLGLHFIRKHHKHLRRIFKLTHLAALPAAPLLGHILGIAGCCALAVTGLCAVGFGSVKAWKSMEGLCSRVFPKFNPPRKARIRAQKILKGISAIPPVRIVGNGIGKIAGKVAEKPLVQKLLKSRLGRLLRGPTQNQQDVFLAAVTIEGSAAWMIGLPAAIIANVAALPAIATVGGIVALAGVAAVALYEVVDCALSITSSTKTLLHIHRARKNAKKSAAEAPVTAPPMQEADAGPVFASTTAVFNQAVGTGAPVETKAPAPARSRRPGFGRSS